MLTVLPLVKARSSEKDVDKTMNIGEISEWASFFAEKNVLGRVFNDDDGI